MQILQIQPLTSNSGICSLGVKLNGIGFLLTSSEAKKFLDQRALNNNVIRPYFRSSDLVKVSKAKFAIDLTDLEIEEIRTKYPEVYQHIFLYVKPERDKNTSGSKKAKWWIFGENQTKMRNAIKDIDSFIVTTRAAKHRVFQFIRKQFLVDKDIIVIASNDLYLFGVLSSKIHQIWVVATGSKIGKDTYIYNIPRCFGSFPFPAANEAQKEKIGFIVENILAHRNRLQQQFPLLTLSRLYNSLEKISAGQPPSSLDNIPQEIVMISKLHQLHKELNTIVTETYGWPDNLNDQEILESLLALNKERSSEEANGIIRYLRPGYQSPIAIT